MAAWSGLFDNVFSDGPHALQFNKEADQRKIARLLRRGANRPLRAIMKALTGSAVGADTALVTRTRIDHDPDALGGLRPVTTSDVINRVTTAADLAEVDDEVLFSASAIAPASYPADLSGNSGGGKLGY